MRPPRDAGLIQDLRLRVIHHNKAHPDAKTKLGDLIKNYKRGYRPPESELRATESVDAYLATLVDGHLNAVPDQVLPWVGVPLSSLPVYEAGAVLFAYLAFPEPDADIRRGEAQIALCNLALQAMAHEDPASQWAPQMMKPGYLLMKDQEVTRIMGEFDRRLRDRRTAARMAIPILQAAETGYPAKLPKGVTQLSIAQMAQFVVREAGEKDPINLRSRTWTPSLPVLHIAIAAEVALDLARTANAPVLDVQLLMRSEDFIRFVVEQAEMYEAILPLAPKLEQSLLQLVRFRLT